MLKGSKRHISIDKYLHIQQKQKQSGEGFGQPQSSMPFAVIGFRTATLMLC